MLRPICDGRGAPATGFTTDFRVAPLPERARPILLEVVLLAGTVDAALEPSLLLRPLRFLRTSCFSSMRCPPPVAAASRRWLRPPSPPSPFPVGTPTAAAMVG